MPERRYILPLQSSGDLVVTWQQGWKICVIRHNGRLIGVIPDLRRLPQRQRTFRMPDGSTLRIEVFYTGSILFDFSLFLNNKLLLHRENVARSLKISYCTILFIAGVNFLTGLLYLSNQLNDWPGILFFLCAGLSSLVFNGVAATLISSAIYLILGLRVWQHSWKALVTAIGLVCLDSAYLAFTLLLNGETAIFAYPLLLSRFIILLAIAMGLQGFRDLQAENLSTSNLASSKASKAEKIIANILALLIDPVSWIFNRIDRNN